MSAVPAPIGYAKNLIGTAAVFFAAEGPALYQRGPRNKRFLLHPPKSFLQFLALQDRSGAQSNRDSSFFRAEPPQLGR